MGPGIVGTIIAITMKDSGIDVGSALALSFPFAVAFQFVITATYTFATTLTSYAYKALDKKNFRGFRIAANATVCVFAVVGFIIGFGGAGKIDRKTGGKQKNLITYLWIFREK